MYNYKIKYQTFDQLIDKIYDEFQMYDSNSLIEPSHILKVVKKINKELGLRISTTKEAVVEFNNYVAKLPNDFQHINYALLCGSYSLIHNIGVQGDHREAEEVTCSKDASLFRSDCGDFFIIINTNNQYGVTLKYPVHYRLKIENTKQLGCTEVYAYIKGDYLKIEHIEEGILFINYESVMEDEDGNLLVVDHPLLNDYYEYAIKRRILENVYFNGEESALQKLQFIEQRYRDAKKEANGVADMPNFKELQDTLELNRKAAHKRFYSKFI